jgi:hypothetical protein
VTGHAVGVPAGSGEDPKVAEARTAAEATDQEIAGDLAAPSHAEAREWLKRPAASRRAAMRMTPEQASKGTL